MTQQYCIPEKSIQQCSECHLINGKLYTSNGYAFPNCPNTQWKQIASWQGTNNTPVYEVVAMPLDDYTPLLGIALIFITFRKRLCK